MDSLDKFFRTMYNRRLVVGAVLGCAIAASPILARITRPTYIATAEVVSVGSGSTTNSVLSLADIQEMALSTEVLKRVLHTTHLKLTLDNLRSVLSIRTSLHSNIIDVVAQSKDRNLASLVSNAEADAIVAGYHSLAGQQYAQLISRLNNQLAVQRAVIASIDTNLQDAAQRDIVAASSHSLDAITDHLTQLQTERTQAQSTFVADSAAASAEGLGSAKDDKALKGVISEQALASDPYYQALRTGQSKDAADYAVMRASFTKDYPGLPGLSSKVAAETSALQQAADSTVSDHLGASATYAQILVQRRAAAAQVAGDKARLAAIDGEISSTQENLRQLPTVGVPANQMRLERDSAAGAYQQLVTRLQMTLADQQQASSLNSLLVLNYASDAGAKIPRIRLVLTMIIIVLGLAIGSAFIAEILDPRLRENAEIEQLYGRPLLGSLS